MINPMTSVAPNATPDVMAAATTAMRNAPSLPVDGVLSTLCQQMKCTFSLRGEEMSAQELMKPEMFLPAVFLAVQDAGYRLLGGDLGCRLRVDERALFGVVASVQPLSGRPGDVLRGLFFTHFATQVFALVENGQIEVEPMFNALKPAFERLLSTSEISAEGEIKWRQIPRPT